MAFLDTRIKKYLCSGFVLRVLIFVSLSYLIIPFIIKSLTGVLQLDRYPYINFFNSSLFFLFALALFWSFNIEKIASHKVIRNKKEIFLLSMLAAGSFLIFLVLGKILDFLYFAIDMKSQIFNYLAVYSVFMSVFIFLFFLIFSVDFVMQFGKQLALVVISTILFYLLSLTLSLNGLWFSTITAKLTYQLLGLTDHNILFDYNLMGDPVIVIDKLPVTIGIPCSGIESLALFISLGFLLVTLSWRKIKKLEAIMLFVIGIMMVFFINLFRVYFLIMIAPYSSELALGLFHSNLGWLIFGIFYILFIKFGYNKLALK